MILFKTGCSGYYNSHWKGVFYPEKLPAKQWLAFYAGQLNTVEINSTFYKFPTKESLAGWSEKTPENFIFSVKAPKIITHLRKFADCETLIHDFYEVCREGLGHQLGCVLFQMPPGFHYSEENLRLITSQLKPGFKNVVEFRHTSWWNEKAYEALALSNITFCNVNHPQLPDTIISNTDIFYIRLHGNPRLFYSDYSSGFMDQLLKTVRNDPTIREAYVYFNNTAGTAGILNALEFRLKTQNSS